MSDVSEDANMSCDYQGYEFGAGSYPDSICIDGKLYDADDCDDSDLSLLYEPMEDIPCPMCREEDAIEYWADRFGRSDDDEAKALVGAKSLVADIRKNRANGTEPWKSTSEVSAPRTFF